jgi:hypothetical protein
MCFCNNLLWQLRRPRYHAHVLEGQVRTGFRQIAILFSAPSLRRTHRSPTFARRPSVLFDYHSASFLSLMQMSLQSRRRSRLLPGQDLISSSFYELKSTRLKCPAHVKPFHRTLPTCLLARAAGLSQLYNHVAAVPAGKWCRSREYFKNKHKTWY